MKIKLLDFGLKASGVEGPAIKHYNDAGADVRIINDVIVPAHSVVKVGLGFGVEIPDGLMGLVFPRSGLNSKGFTTLYSPIDAGYRGEISVNLYNTTDEGITFYKGDRVGQLVIIPYIQADYCWELGDERGAGGFGSTGMN